MAARWAQWRVVQVAIPNTFLEQGIYSIMHSSAVDTTIESSGDHTLDGDLDLLKAAERDASELESASFNALFRLLSSPDVKGYTGVVFNQENGFIVVADSVDERPLDPTETQDTPWWRQRREGMGTNG